MSIKAPTVHTKVTVHQHLVMTAASQHVPRVMGITDFVALAVKNVLGHLPLVVPSTVESAERQSYNIHILGTWKTQSSVPIV